MMIESKQYVEKYKNASCFELLKFKNELISCISDSEHDFDKEEWSWESSPGPDVGYQLNLELLGLIAPLLKEPLTGNMKREIKIWMIIRTI